MTKLQDTEVKQNCFLFFWKVTSAKDGSWLRKAYFPSQEKAIHSKLAGKSCNSAASRKIENYTTSDDATNEPVCKTLRMETILFGGLLYFVANIVRERLFG
jgi:hypothetical protein